MKSLGTGTYFPRVYDFFPKLARGHGAQHRFKKIQLLSGDIVKGNRANELCLAVSCTLRNGKGERHEDQAQNRKDWEESVGIRRASRTSHHAQSGMRTAATTSIDPKDLAAKG